MDDENDELRRHATECQRMADSVQGDDDKRQWMRLAEKWLRMITPEATAADIDNAKARSDRFDGEVSRHGTRQEESDSSH